LHSLYYEKRLLASKYLFVRPSVRMEQLGSHCTDFHKILQFSTFRKSVDNIQDSLKSDKNNGYFTRRPIYIFDHILFISSWNQNVSDKRCRETQNTHFIFNKFFPKTLKFVR